MKKLNIDKFVNSYLYTAAWVSCDGDENTEFTTLATEIARQDCNLFIAEVLEKFGEVKALELLTIEGNDLDYLAAHDFFLTRCGHGAGFWDKPEIYGENEAEQLTAICKNIGNTDVIHVKGKKSKLMFI